MKNDFNRNEKPDQMAIDAFVSAAFNNDMGGVDSFLQCYGDQYINEKNTDGNTALISAAWNGRTDIATALIDRGAKLDEKGKHGYTALILAAFYSHTTIATALIGKGAKLDEKNNAGFTALDWAENQGHRDIAGLIRAAQEQRMAEEKQREIDEAIATVYAGIAEDMDIAAPLRFKKKGPVVS
jgi:ankyrin repeat protein